MMCRCCGNAGRTILNGFRFALAIFGGRIILIRAMPGSLRTVRHCIFTGRVVEESGICCAGFLRKHPRCRERPHPLRPLTAFASTSPKGRGLGTEIKFAATTPPVKIAFVAARRPQQTRNKNILSAVHGQSKAEAIQNRPAIRKDAEKNQSYYKRSSP